MSERTTRSSAFIRGAALLIAAAVIASCGSDEAVEGFEHPTGADELIVQHTEIVGFTTFVRGFQSPPITLISGDRRLIRLAPTAAVFPGPLLPVFEVRSITEDGVQTVLGAAAGADLYRDVEYARDERLADASITEVLLAADGGEWGHRAVGLVEMRGQPGPPGMTPEEEADRQALAEFAESMIAIEALLDEDDLGDTGPYEADAYLFVARPVEAPSTGSGGGEPGPEVVPWPESTGIALADVTSCVEASHEQVGELFRSADELTLFEDDGVVYEVAPIQQLPGRTC